MTDDYHFEVNKERPEESYEDVRNYFKGRNLERYANSKNMMRIQQKITIRALELMEIPRKNSLILDAGCGPGFAGMLLKEMGYNIISLDLIPQFLLFYNLSELNPISADMSLPPFKENCFDGIISISALQWIYKKINNTIMYKNLVNLAKNFYTILNLGSKAVIQFYPKNNIIMKQIGHIIRKNTLFEGNFIIDSPDNPKKRKIFLILKKK